MVLPEPVGPEDDPLEQVFLRLVDAELLEVETLGLLVENTHHDAFAMPGGQSGDANVHRAAGNPQADAPVLREALLGDVEA